MTLPVLDADTVRDALPMPVAIAALRDALAAGLDPEADPPRTRVPVRRGELLLMPAEANGYAGVKLASVAPDNPAVGRPRIQGAYLLLDGETLTPRAVLDGVALTAVRTAAVSAVAVDALAPADAHRLVVFGAGPQAYSHVAALRAIRPVRQVVVVGRDPGRAAALAEACAADGLHARTGGVADVADADLVACCTTAREPLFDGTLLGRYATVAAVGSHTPDARELDDAAVTGSTVVVESRAAALREAGDLIGPVRDGRLDADTFVNLAELVTGTRVVGRDRPSVFKSVGMAWQDLVVAASCFERCSP